MDFGKAFEGSSPLARTIKETSLDLIRKCGSLRTAVGIIDRSGFQYAGNEDFANPAASVLRILQRPA
jgi:hypothetical protein